MRSFLFDENLSDIGRQLIDHSRQEVSSGRGMLDELFPYIVVASKSMSARAISRWLEDVKNIKLSAASVSKAIREKEVFLEKIYQRVLQGAEYLARISDYDAKTILISENHELDKLYRLYEENLNGSEKEQEWAKDLGKGFQMLREWMSLPVEIKEMCIEMCIKNRKEN